MLYIIDHLRFKIDFPFLKIFKSDILWVFPFLPDKALMLELNSL